MTEDSRLQTLKSIAADLHEIPKTIARWRDKEGMPFIQLGLRSRRYRRKDIDEWATKKRRQKESASPGRRGSGSLRSGKGS